MKINLKDEIWSSPNLIKKIAWYFHWISWFILILIPIFKLEVLISEKPLSTISNWILVFLAVIWLISLMIIAYTEEKEVYKIPIVKIPHGMFVYGNSVIESRFFIVKKGTPITDIDISVNFFEIKSTKQLIRFTVKKFGSTNTNEIININQCGYMGNFKYIDLWNPRPENVKKGMEVIRATVTVRNCPNLKELIDKNQLGTIWTLSIGDPRSPDSKTWSELEAALL